MSSETGKDFSDIFGGLSSSGKNLLISMVHFSTNLGGNLDAISATSGLSKEDLSQALDDLSVQGLIRRGKVGGERDKNFIDDENGSRYALSKMIKKDIIGQVLKMKVDENDAFF